MELLKMEDDTRRDVENPRAEVGDVERQRRGRGSQRDKRWEEEVGSEWTPLQSRVNPIWLSRSTSRSKIPCRKPFSLQKPMKSLNLCPLEMNKPNPAKGGEGTETVVRTMEVANPPEFCPCAWHSPKHFTGFGSRDPPNNL